MARFFRAVARFGPRVEHGSKVGLPQLSDYMSASSGLNPNIAAMAIAELTRALVFFLKLGMPVVIPGLGRLRLTVDRHGELRLHFVADKELRAEVLDPEGFGGRIERAEATDWTDADYKAAWDAEFPEDPLDLPTKARSAKRHLGPGRPSRLDAARRG